MKIEDHTKVTLTLPPNYQAETLLGALFEKVKNGEYKDRFDNQLGWIIDSGGILIFTHHDQLINDGGDATAFVRDGQVVICMHVYNGPKKTRKKPKKE